MSIIAEHPIPFFLLLISFVVCYLGDFLFRRTDRVTRILFPVLEWFVGVCGILLILCYGGDVMLILCVLLVMLFPLLL